MTDPEPSKPELNVPNPGVPKRAASPPVTPLRSDLPLIGGRLWVGIALLVGIAAVSAQYLNTWIDVRLHPESVKPRESWKVGTEANVEVTLITADAKRLHCAHDDVIDGVHCGYAANKRPWPRQPNAPMDDNDRAVIQPYRTADTDALVLIAGLWAEPELALRLHREPPNLTDVDKHLRFVAYCKVRFIGELKGAALRWEAGAQWGTEPTAIVARPVHCTLDAPSG